MRMHVHSIPKQEHQDGVRTEKSSISFDPRQLSDNEFKMKAPKKNSSFECGKILSANELSATKSKIKPGNAVYKAVLNQE